MEEIISETRYTIKDGRAFSLCPKMVYLDAWMPRYEHQRSPVFDYHRLVGY